MRKSLLSLVAAAAVMLGVGNQTVLAQEAGGAEEYTYHLLVVHTNGTEVKVPFEQNPTFRHDGTALQLTSDELEVSYPAGDLSHFKIVAEKKEVMAVQVIDATPKPRPVFSQEAVEITNAQPGEAVTVVTLDGRVIGTAVVDSEGKASVALDRLNTGIYIVRAGQTSFKMIKK